MCLFDFIALRHASILNSDEADLACCGVRAHYTTVLLQGRQGKGTAAQLAELTPAKDSKPRVGVESSPPHMSAAVRW